MADNPVWPDTLPQSPYLPDNGTPEYDPADNSIRTGVTVGPAKLRRRFTAVPSTCKIRLMLNGAQLDTFHDFVENQVEDVMPFTWVDFRNGAQATYRLPKGRGSYTEKYDSSGGRSDVYAADMWIVDLELEMLP